MYHLDEDAIRGLNVGSLGESSLIEVGQEIVISPPVATPTPEPIFSVCVVAFNDRNGDQAWDDGAEEMLPGALFTLTNGSGVVDEYISDGLNEPHCFVDLPPGSYDVAHASPGGYEPIGPGSEAVEARADAPPAVAFGSIRGAASAASAAGPTATPAEVAEATLDATQDDGSVAPGDDELTDSAGQIVLSAVSKISGVLMLVLALGMGALFYFERRKA